MISISGFSMGLISSCKLTRSNFDFLAPPTRDVMMVVSRPSRGIPVITKLPIPANMLLGEEEGGWREVEGREGWRGRGRGGGREGGERGRKGSGGWGL